MRNKVKITWLGQAGLLFEICGKKIMVDPYLSDSVEKINYLNYRRVPVKQELLEIKPDMIILTHNHLDHTDPETLKHYLSTDSSVTVLASCGAWQEARKFGGTGNNYVMFNEGTRWTQGDVVFQAVKAEHSDDYAIGVILSYEGSNYYVTGDTLYNTNVIKSVQGLCSDRLDVVFLPVNGVGNNMNFADAAMFAEKIGAKKAVPMHCGLFDELDMQGWSFEHKIVPEFYKEIELED